MDALNTIRSIENDHFAGMLSSVYAGDRLAAVHFGMRSHAVWHWWFPTYDLDLDKYSPGLILLLELARQAPGLGLIRLDLGRGHARYKTAFASGATPLIEGSIEYLWSLAGSFRRVRKLTHKCLESTPLDTLTDVQRRAFDRILGAVKLTK